MPDWFCLHNDAIYCPLCKGTLASSKHVTNHRMSVRSKCTPDDRH